MTLFLQMRFLLCSPLPHEREQSVHGDQRLHLPSETKKKQIHCEKKVKTTRKLTQKGNSLVQELTETGLYKRWQHFPLFIADDTARELIPRMGPIPKET